VAFTDLALSRRATCGHVPLPQGSLGTRPSPAGHPADPAISRRAAWGPVPLPQGNLGTCTSPAGQPADPALSRRATCGWDMGVPGGGYTRHTGDDVARGQAPAGSGAQPRLPGQARRPGQGSSLLHPVSQPRFPRHPPGDPLSHGLGPEAVPETSEPLPENRVRPRDASPPADG
jgi:hypothetical protein